MKKKNHLLLNGFLLAALFVFLLVWFIKIGFTAPHAVILLIVAALSAFQLWIYYSFFGKNQKK